MMLRDRLCVLANTLAAQSLQEEAVLILAQALELCDVRDIQVIPPGHPLYETTRNVLRPHEVINEKLENFSNRLKV